jgi:hypothetical protein
VATNTFYTQCSGNAVALQIAYDLSFDWLTVRANASHFAAVSPGKQTENCPPVEQ